MFRLWCDGNFLLAVQREDFRLYLTRDCKLNPDMQKPWKLAQLYKDFRGVL